MLKIRNLELLGTKCDVYFNEHVIRLDRNALASAIKDVERWQYGGSSSFNVMLVSLIAKADDNNKSKLMQAYPEFVIAHNLWFWKDCFCIDCKSDEEFFKEAFERLKYEEQN